MSQPPHDEPSATSATAAGGDEDLLVALADEFAARLRRGEDPTVEEYAARHPGLADRIHKVFSAIALVEDARSPHPTHAGEQPGATVGRYKLLERIGEGGFGVVYMAEQTSPVRRKVALKIVKPGMDSRQVLARFDAERQALAIMDHPNIAKVFDGGMTETGRPYFVMELVKGEPITAYCDANQLPPRQRLELFVQVCDAVQHAHQKGIIHRDIKPTNVLVMMHDTKPVVKVIDFGVAKALGQELTERTLFTGFAQLVGTPLYMSPEQAGHSALDVDTRSDIYSLGVLLYELLTGTTPFDRERFKRAAQEEIRRIIREEEPPRPSTRLSESKEKLPSISAQRHTEPAKLTKLVRGELDWIVMKALEKDRGRRYETATGFGSDVRRYLAGEAVQAVPPSAGYRLKKFARRNKRVLAAASAMIAMLLVLIGVLSVSNVRVARERNEKSAALVDREAALNSARESAARAEAERQRAESNFLKARTAVANIMARAATGQAEWAKLPSSLRKVFAAETTRYYESLIQGAGTDPSARYETAVGYRSLGFLHGSAKEFEPAEKYYRQSVQMLEALVKESADNLDFQQQLASSNLHLGSVLKATTRPVEARTAYERSVELYEELLVKDGAPKAEYSYDLNRCYTALQQLNPGHDYRERLVALRRSNVERDPKNFANHAALGTVLREQSKFEEAAAAYRKAAELNPNHAGTYTNLSFVLSRLRKPEEAATAARRAVEIDPTADGAWVNLGVDLWRLQQYDEAAAAFRKAIDLDPKDGTRYGNVGRPASVKPQVAAYGNLGRMLHQQRKFDEAAAVWRELLERDPELIEAHFGLGRALFGQKKSEEAIAALKKGLAIDPQFADGNNLIAWVLVTAPDTAVRDPGLALTLAEKAVELDPKNGAYLDTLGIARYRTGDWTGAIAAFEKSMELRKDGDGGDYFFFLAMAHWRLGDKDEARRWYEKAVKWMEEKAPQHETLIRFRSEAAELLGETVPAGTQPTTRGISSTAATRPTTATAPTTTAPSTTPAK